MPEPSWEAANNTAMHGYLKFLDFQAAGLDVHATFMKDKTVHISVYAVGSTTDQKLGQQNMNIGVSGLTLGMSGRLQLKNAVSPKNPMPDGFWAFLEDRCTRKATELGVFAPQTPSLTQPAPLTTATVQKGGSSGIPKTSTWGDKFQQTKYESEYPTPGQANTKG